MTSENFLKRKLVTPLLNYLKQGISPEKLALAVVLGMSIATIPVFGSSTILCLTAVYIFKLNLPAILLVNNFAYPLQFALYIPFMKMGDRLFNSSFFQFTISEVFEMFKNNIWNAILSLWWATMHALVAWMIIIVPLSFILYFIIVPLFKKLSLK